MSRHWSFKSSNRTSMFYVTMTLTGSDFLFKIRDQLLCLLPGIKANHHVRVSATSLSWFISTRNHDRRNATSNVKDPYIVASIFSDAASIQALRAIDQLNRGDSFKRSLSSRARNAATTAKASLIKWARTIVNANPSLICPNHEETRSKTNNEADASPNQSMNSRTVERDSFCGDEVD